MLLLQSNHTPCLHTVFHVITMLAFIITDKQTFPTESSKTKQNITDLFG